MPPAARVTDMHVCPMVTGLVPHVGGPILPPGAPTVLIDFLPAATVTTMATCIGPPDLIVKGSAGVMINFLPAARLGDQTAHGGVIVMGAPNVIIGEIGSPSPGAAGLGGVMAGLVSCGALGNLVPNASILAQGGQFAVIPYVPVVDSKCAAKKASATKLTADTSARIEKLLGTKPQATGTQPGDFGTQLRPGNWSPCQNRADDMSAVLRRFNRYSAAIPSARAALNTNDLGDAAGGKAKSMDCVTRLPDTGSALSAALGLPPGTITDADLRNDKTGFRAAMYRSDADGSLILVARDTEPQSLVDWKTNTDNGQGLETDQYDAMRTLTAKLVAKGVPFNMAGYSKGGGMAQEAGLLNTSGNVIVFNSAGIPADSAGRTATTTLDNLASRTSAFSSQGDFLTYLNQTADPGKQIENAEWLKAQLAKSGAAWNPIGLTYLDPETKDIKDPDFATQKAQYLNNLQELINKSKQDLAAGRSFQLFPPVRTSSFDTIPESPGILSKILGVNKQEPSMGKLNQHQMTVVEKGMEDTIASDSKAMQSFLAQCQ